MNEGKEQVDPRLADVVRYRIGRKQAHTLAKRILEEYTSPMDGHEMVEITSE